MEKFFINLDRYGNTSSASIPVALCEAVEAGRIQPGDHVAMVGFGAGLTWAGAIVTVGRATAARAGVETNTRRAALRRSRYPLAHTLIAAACSRLAIRLAHARNDRRG